MSEVLNQTLDSKNQNNTPEPVGNSIEYFKGKLCSLLVPGDMLLGTKLGEWYETNEYHKFQVGDYIILKSNNSFGYGVRPVGQIKDFIFVPDTFAKEGDKKVGRYIIDMHGDVDGNFHDWRKKGIIKEGTSRDAAIERHFKWNIENHFKRVNVGSFEEALELYNSWIYKY